MFHHPRLVPGLFLAAALLAGLALASPVRAFLGFSSGPEKLTPSAGQVSLPLADLADGKVHFFAVSAQGTDIRFFLVKSPDGRVRAAFDACDVCYPAGKGYRQEGNAVVCANCGRKFAITMVGEVRGGCNPAPLATTVSGDQVVIKTADLEAGATFFQGEASGSPRS